MAKCLNVDCSNEVVSQEGKRQKKTCSDSCRQKVWQKNRQDAKFIKVPCEEWKRLTTIENNLLKKVIEDKINTIPLELTAPLEKMISNLKKEFRRRREDEDVFEYGAAKSEWKLNNQ